MTADTTVRELIRTIEHEASLSWGFQARQRLTAPGIDVMATVRRGSPSFLHVEFERYDSALLASEETLAGTVEFSNEELAGSVVSTDGRMTWVFDPASRVAIRKSYATAFEPIPGLTAFGEVSFLATLGKDFLIRDHGSHTVDGRTARRLGLKPKAPYRSQLLRAVALPIVRATLVIDEETLFPAQITFTPSPESPAGSLLGQDQEIVVRYSQVKRVQKADAPPPFEPPSDAIVFAERNEPIEEALACLERSVSLDTILASGLQPSHAPAVLSTEQDGTRCFSAIRFSRQSSEPHAPTQQLLLLAGNYLSRRMSRLRTVCREQGESVDLIHGSGWCYNRSTLWKQLLPGIEATQAPVDYHWEKDGAFWFACFSGIANDEALELTDSIHAPRESSPDAEEAAGGTGVS